MSGEKTEYERHEEWMQRWEKIRVLTDEAREISEQIQELRINRDGLQKRIANERRLLKAMDGATAKAAAAA